MVVPSSWGHFKSWLLKTCDKQCWKKGVRRKGNRWWLNGGDQGRKMYIRRCVGIVPKRTRGGIKAIEIKKIKQFKKEGRRMKRR